MQPNPMVQTETASQHARAKAPADSAVRAWWMLVHQLPPQPPGVRMRVWRRLATLGALQIKGSVYVLPATEAAREDLEWLLGEIRAADGDGSIWRSEAIAGIDDEDLILRFHAAVASEYEALQREAIALQQGIQRKRQPMAANVAKKTLGKLRVLFDEIGQRDHFHAPRREVAGALLTSIEQQLAGGVSAMKSASSGTFNTAGYRGRTWVTRARVRVDRMASAWLIRRFIDPAAEFAFVEDAGSTAAGPGIRFDMYGGEFTHEGEQCTFEVLLRRFGLSEPGLDTIAHIVHDIDLKESRYGVAETAGVAASLDAIASAALTDAERLAFAGTLFDGLLMRFSDKGP
ncbi:MAG: chromate resistance protein ChrB domain-containing protein [Pseudomarimonas sp.]